MKIWITALLVISILSAGGCKRKQANDSAGSGFDRTAINEKNLENLEVLGRVWGYVKYHHPIFSATAKIDIDRNLFELLPQVADADRENRNKILTEWIDGLGEFSVCPEKYDSLPVDFIQRQEIDLNWISDTIRLGKNLTDRLQRLRYANRGEMYYATSCRDEREGSGPNVCFSNEKTYSDASELDYGYRLLAVFRFWNMVEYFFPMKYLIERPWGEILPEYIELMASMPDGDYQHTMWRMIAQIKDSHAMYDMEFYYRLFGEYRAPVDLVSVDDKIIVATNVAFPPSESTKFHLKAGDQIFTVNGNPVNYYLSEVSKYVPCSNANREKELSADAVFRTHEDRPLRICFRRGIKFHNVVMNVTKRPLLQHESPWEKPTRILSDDSIVYVNLNSYTKKDEIQLSKMLAAPDAVIFDMRSLVSMDFHEYMLDKLRQLPDNTPTPWMYTYPNILLPGTFSSNSPVRSFQVPPMHKRAGVVLVGNWVQSSCETLVQWMQYSNNIITVGNRTAGADGNISRIDLPGGVKTCLSGLGWYYNNGVEVQRQGVRIDYEIHPTIEGIKAGRDEVLEKAIELIRKNRYI